MTPYPKPPVKVKAPKPLKARGPLPRRGKPPKKGNAYTRPEWRALVREVRKRSGGICEARVRCGGDPVQGDPHHFEYADFVGWRRLIVPLDKLLDCCHECHTSFHRES